MDGLTYEAENTTHLLSELVQGSTDTNNEILKACTLVIAIMISFLIVFYFLGATRSLS